MKRSAVQPHRYLFVIKIQDFYPKAIHSTPFFCNSCPVLLLNNPFHTVPLSHQVILLRHSCKASTQATLFPPDYPPSSRSLRHLVCQDCHLLPSSPAPHLILGASSTVVLVNYFLILLLNMPVSYRWQYFKTAFFIFCNLPLPTPASSYP